MFTGIVESLGTVRELVPAGGDSRLLLDAGDLDLSALTPGDSVCVSGVCLTATQVSDRGFGADVSGETLAHTTLGDLRPGSRVNLERALTLSSRLGGHLVSGHVDGVAAVEDFTRQGRSWRLAIRVPTPLARYVARKGSVCVDGVSLTVNDVAGERFGVNIVPHTLERTIIGRYGPGSRVNLEVDLVARYLERLLLGGLPSEGSGDGLSLEALARHGFLRQSTGHGE